MGPGPTPTPSDRLRPGPGSHTWVDPGTSEELVTDNVEGRIEDSSGRPLGLYDGPGGYSLTSVLTGVCLCALVRSSLPLVRTLCIPVFVRPQCIHTFLSLLSTHPCTSSRVGLHVYDETMEDPAATCPCALPSGTG